MYNRTMPNPIYPKVDGKKTNCGSFSTLGRNKTGYLGSPIIETDYIIFMQIE
jgi:hypothetical protein